jgi:transcriptional regulator of acetoin/glycerol metabolism
MKLQETFSTFPHPELEKHVMEAWDRFLTSGKLSSDAVRNVIERSWRRCHDAGIDSARVHAPDPLSESSLDGLRQRYRELVEASVPILGDAHELLSESGTMMVLTDPSGVILETEGDPATLDAALDIRLTAGATWNELLCGTNAIGTALAAGEPVQVHAAEHFCAGIKPWTCSATPVRDPVTGELLGVLDVSGLRSAFSRHALALVVAAAGRIEARLAGHEAEQRHRLLEWGLGHRSKLASGGVLFFDRKGRLIKAEPRAGASLTSMGIELDPKIPIEAFTTDSAPPAGKRMLPEWLRAEWVQPVIEDADRLGTIGVLPDHTSGTRPAARRPGAAPSDPDMMLDGSSGHLVGDDGLEELIGISAEFKRVLREVAQVGPTDATVLITGETGTGKELVARRLHAVSPRRHRPLVVVNCAALPASLIESELFGHERGAFTGAVQRKLGRFELAHGGTIFLDEVGDLPLDSQARFLRVLQEGEFERVGGTSTVKVDVRVIAATNRPLESLVGEGQFRADLFYRLNVYRLAVPPLRERLEDIWLLVNHFVRKFRARFNRPIGSIDGRSMERLLAYGWPGNVRELEHTIERAVLLAEGEVLTVELPAERSLDGGNAGETPQLSGQGRTTLVSLEESERQYIQEVLRHTGGQIAGKSGAAQVLGGPPSTLRSRMKKLGLS